MSKGFFFHSAAHFCEIGHNFCVEVLRPNQSIGAMSSAVSLPNHTLPWQVSPLNG